MASGSRCRVRFGNQAKTACMTFGERGGGEVAGGGGRGEGEGCGGGGCGGLGLPMGGGGMGGVGPVVGL